ncbi:IS200/IS605 family transposase [Thioclava sp. DLFJ4-1]|uniref:IS200/IS605 family transposase n=1 Tax=Thioclava sp. DLFJ4-1 TaxID=1915313 RepID=UPI00099643D6|nr:IS200/IS605 family transposase [Thioclava sp. DLFJ4-1]OOY15042.1 hypothetical protein BMI85_15950 [Thioclava sp. DLFJ4-1]
MDNIGSDMKNQYYINENNCFFDISYKMVLATKGRQSTLSREMHRVAKHVTLERCRARNGDLLEFSGAEDHLEISFSLPPSEAVSSFANAVKTSISRRLRRDFPELKLLGAGLWAPSYFVASLGNPPEAAIQHYLQSEGG